MRIVVAGSGRLGASVMTPLMESRHDVVGLLQNGRAVRGLNRYATSLGARFFGAPETPLVMAARARVPVIWLDDMSEVELRAIASLEPDLIVTCGFSIILDRRLLDLPRIGCMNVHSSLLPKHRGPTPFTHVILAGDLESGVSFHVTEEAIDAGDILDQFAFTVSKEDTALSVYQKSCGVVVNRIVEVVDRIETDGLVGEAQNPSDAAYEKALKKADMLIDWNAPAEEIERLVRAFMPPHYPHFVYRNRVVRVARAEFDPKPVDAAPGMVLQTAPSPQIATGSGVVTLTRAFTEGLATMRWPMPWNILKVGERLG